MIVPKTTINVIYISLGSNIEPRFDFLKSSYFLINSRIGTITQFSKIYETPPWGFVSTLFLNACICVHTSLNTRETLHELQKIERELGRKKQEVGNYEARSIDLDIIYSSEGIFYLPDLIVPHPLMNKRKFVLIPLLDIAPNLKHPLRHQTTEQLKMLCEDTSVIQESEFSFMEVI